MSDPIRKPTIFANDDVCRFLLRNATGQNWISVFAYADGYGKLMTGKPQFVGPRNALYKVRVRPRAQFSRNDRLRSSVSEAMPTSMAAESGSSVSQERSASPIPLDWRM